MVDMLQSRGYMRIPYPSDVRIALQRAVDSWERFCALDAKIKQSVPYMRRDQLGVGYECKLESGKGKDRKENLHVMIAMMQEFEAIARHLDLAPLHELLRDAHMLIGALSAPMLALARELEHHYKLHGLEREMLRSRPEWMVRFIHYFGDQEAGSEIASAHADKSGLTSHLYESDHGFEYLDHRGRWRRLAFNRASMMLLPDMQMQYRSKGELKALWHRVVATEQTAKHGRVSIVCFMSLLATPVVDKSRIGRLQDMSPGFNYEMPFAEFAKLFVKEK